MFNRILVPLDGSALAERSIPHAEEFARIFGSNIILLQVLEPTSSHGTPNSTDPLGWQIRKAEADVYMRGIADRIQTNLLPMPGESEHRVRVEYIILEGKSAENIIDFAHDQKVDLLIISTHGSGGLSRWNLSSVIQKVVNLIYLPVLIVRAYTPPKSDDPRIRYQNILVPIDSSRRAECSLPAGIALASGENAANRPFDSDSQPPSAIETPSHAKLTLMGVIKPPEIPVSDPCPAEIKQLSDQLMKISHEATNSYLKEMKERLPAECEVCIVESNSVSSAIHETASREEVDLVILCAHGYTGDVSWPFGSIARNYIEHGTKPVLVIQDIPQSKIQPTAAEIAAGKTGRR